MSQLVSLADSIGQIPPITRFFTVLTVAVAFLLSLQIVDVSSLTCSLPFFIEESWYTQQIFTSDYASGYEKVVQISKLISQIYRFLTCFLVPGGFVTGNMNPGNHFSGLMEIYFFYSFAVNVEKNKFRHNFPDCLWFTLVCGTILLLVSFIYNLFDVQHISKHHQMMSSCITYIWIRSQKNSIISFLGIIPIKAYYLPLFTVSLKGMVEGYDSMVDTIIGIVGGYLYQCIQSGTWPIYNLFPQFYSHYYANDRHKLGTNMGREKQDYIPDAVFDYGYLDAPSWLYSLLKFNRNPTSYRRTAYSDINPTKKVKEKVLASTTAFQGTGHRLGS